MIKFKSVPSNLNNLKSKVDKLDVDKLLTVPIVLSKVKNDVYNAKYKWDWEQNTYYC